MERVDFLVIGAGIAGLSAAIRLADVGTVLVVTKEELAESNTVTVRIAGLLRDLLT